MKKTILFFLFIIFSTLKTFSQSCLPNGITFTTQSAIDSFQFNYPNCTEIEGNLVINGAAITNLNGLNTVKTVGGDLVIVDNNILITLSGLDNLDSIGGVLGIISNDIITDLTSLTNLVKIGGNLAVGWNHSLKSLSGLNNIASESIHDLFIYYNDSLTNCAIESICNYLDMPSGAISIYENSSGCDSAADVDSACTNINVPDIKYLNDFVIFPNPVSDELFIVCPEHFVYEEIKIYNIIGQIIKTFKGQYQKIDISTIRQGIYFLEFVSKEMKMRKKIIIK